MAGGLFLAPIVGGAEPRGQRAGVLALLAALAVVFGSLGGEWLGINDRLGTLWLPFGHQGSEYLDLGRFWQLLLAAGLAGWLVLMYRALRPASTTAGARPDWPRLPLHRDDGRPASSTCPRSSSAPAPLPRDRQFALLDTLARAEADPLEEAIRSTLATVERPVGGGQKDDLTLLGVELL